MTALLVVVVLWIAVLVPPAVKSRNDRRQEFLDSFQRGLGALGAAGSPTVSPSPEPPPVPRRQPSAAERRRTILGLLLASMVISLVPAVVMGGKATLVVHLAVDNLFLAYVGMLVRVRDARARARTPVPAVVSPSALAWDDEDEPLVVAAPRVRTAIPGVRTA